MYALGFPVLSRVTSEDEVHRLRRRMVHTVTLVLFPLLTALAIVAPKFVTWFYGPAWHAAVVPVQILTIGGAAMLVAEAVTVAMLATGRARAVMWWGWGHFLVYGGCRFRRGSPWSVAVACAAVVVHTTFLMIAYLQLHHGRLRRAFKTLAKDVLPAASAREWAGGRGASGERVGVDAGHSHGPLSAHHRSRRRCGLLSQPSPLVSERAPSPRSYRGACASCSRPSSGWSVRPAGGAWVIGLVKRPEPSGAPVTLRICRSGGVVPDIAALREA